jgi:hypothetical protein
MAAWIDSSRMSWSTTWRLASGPCRALTLVEARQVISVMVKAWMDWLHAGRPPIP